MILTANPSRGSSRAGFWTVLGLGALLLPLSPGAAQTEAPARPEQPARVESKPKTVKAEIEFELDPSPYADVKWKSRISDMQNCASCHQAPVHSRDLQQKPQPWQATHDEAIRLWEETRRKRAELRVVANRLPAATEREHAEQIEKLQDEIELLKVQVKLRQAHLEAAKVDFDVAEQLYGRMRTVGGAVSQSEISKAAAAMTSQRAQIRIREAELQEPLIRLKQAERRLARLRGPAERSAAGGREQQEQRLRELEKKVNQILEEMKNLQRELHRDKPSKPADKPA